MNDIDIVRQDFAKRYGAKLLDHITKEEITGILLNTSSGCSTVYENHERAVVDMRFLVMEKRMKQLLPPSL